MAMTTLLVCINLLKNSRTEQEHKTHNSYFYLRKRKQSCALLRCWIAFAFSLVMSVPLSYAKEEHIASSPIQHSERKVWRSNEDCGYNCLLVLLRLHGVEIDYASFYGQKTGHRFNGVGSNGLSLLQVKELATAYGVPGIVGKTSPEGLKVLPKPIIAHLDDPNGEGSGHYVIILDCSDNDLTIMDGTTFGITHWPWR